jgi:hypothetical protein
LFSETPSRPLAEMRSVFGLLESVKLRRVALESPFGSTTVLTMGLAKGYSTMQIVPVLAEGMWTDTLRVGGRQERGVWGIDHDNVIISAALPPVAEIAPPSGPNCNNGQIDPDEDCDGDNLGGFRCADFEGFNGGTLICTSHCSWDFRDCVKGPRPTPGASCGNGVKEPGEACDGEDFGGLTCEGIGGPAGTKLFCKDCTIDLDTSCHCDGKLCGHTCVPTGSACCGDGVAQGDEQCDGGDLRGATCASVGFAGGGTLRCTNGCALDVRACQSCDKVCPDGSCVPAGANCCGGGRFCASGTVCVAGGKCCPANLPQACGTLCIAQDAVCCGGAGFCDPGQVCAGGNRACCPKNRPQLCGAFCGPEDELCCPGGGSCPAELVCTSRPGACCTADSPQLCGDGCIPQDAVCCGGGNYCPRGSKCLDNGMCSSDTGPPSAATSSGRAASDGGPVRSGKQPAQKLHH